MSQGLPIPECVVSVPAQLTRFVPWQGARGEIGRKGERGDPGLPVSQLQFAQVFSEFTSKPCWNNSS